MAKAIHDREFNSRRSWIDEGLLRYSDRKAYHAALRLADELLNYVPCQRFTALLQIERRMKALQGHGITGLDVVRRVCAYVDFIQRRPPPDQRSEDYALARAVIRLAPIGKYRPQTNVLKFFAPMVRERLYPFAHAFLSRLKADADAERALITDSCDFNTPNTLETP